MAITKWFSSVFLHMPLIYFNQSTLVLLPCKHFCAEVIDAAQTGCPDFGKL